MGWKLLKKRRWEGPYSPEQLRTMLDEKKIVASDFLLDESNDEKFPTNYKTVAEVLGVESKTPSKSESKVPNASIDPTVENLDEEEGGFSEFDREEVTKLFDEQVEPTDLLPSKKSTSFSSAPQSDEEEDFEILSNSERQDESQGLSAKFRSLPLNQIATTLVVVLMLGFVVYGANEFFNFGAMMGQNSESESLQKSASKTANKANVQPKRRPASRPKRVRERIKLPESRPRPAPRSNRAPSNYEDYDREDDYVEQSERRKPKRKSRSRRDNRDQLYDDERDDGYDDDREREPYGESEGDYDDNYEDDRRGADNYRDEPLDDGYGDEENVDEYRDEEVENNDDY